MEENLKNQVPHRMCYSSPVDDVICKSLNIFLVSVCISTGHPTLADPSEQSPKGIGPQLFLGYVTTQTG